MKFVLILGFNCSVLNFLFMSHSDVVVHVKVDTQGFLPSLLGKIYALQKVPKKQPKPFFSTQMFIYSK